MNNPISLISLLLTLSLTYTTSSTCSIDSTTLSFSTIDFSNVPSTSIARTLDNTVSTCICDLNINFCDAIRSCSCDVDCTTTDITRFKYPVAETAKDYLFNPPSISNITYCATTDLLTINNRGDISASLLNNILCVSISNNPTKGYFLNGVMPLTSAAISTALTNLVTYSFNRPELVAVASSDLNYRDSDNILAAYYNITSSSLLPLNRGYFSIPSQGFDSKCTDNHFAKYLLPYKSSCLRVITDLSTTCSSTFSYLSPVHNIQNIVVAKIKGAVLSSTANFITIFARSVSYRTTSATSIDYTTLFTINKTIDAFPYDSTKSVNFNLSEPLFTFDVNTFVCKCANVIQEIDYIFSYDSSGQVLQVFADVILTDVQSTATTNSSSSCAAAVLDQSYTSSWRLNNTSTVVGVVPNRSGRPGYYLNLPVLAGVSSLDSSSGKTAISNSSSGFSIPGSDLNGACSYNVVNRVPIMFGQDSMQLCSVSLTASELETRCSSNGFLDFLPNLNFTHLGMFGDSNSLLLAEWISITKDTPTSSQWFSSTKTCSGIVNSAFLTIFYSRSGNTLNPQNIIVASTLTYTTATLQYDLSFSSPPSTSRSFPIRFSVSFINVPADNVIQYLPATPSVLPSMPSDVLYPLYLGSASNVSVGLGMSITIIAAIILLLI